MSIRFLWLGKLLECLYFIIEGSLPTYIPELWIPSVSKGDFAHFLKCHNKAWFGPVMQTYARHTIWTLSTQAQIEQHKLMHNIGSTQGRGKRNNKNLMLKMIWEFCVYVDQV